MTDTRTDTNTVSVVERTRAVAAGGPIVGAHVLGRTAVFVLGEEALVFAEPEGELRRMDVHGGVILASASDGARIVTGGDDGKVVTTDLGSTRVLAADAKHRWIDHVALGPDGAVAWSAGKMAFTQAKELREFEAPSTVGGLAFLPKGFRLAIAHYNGATLWFPNAAGATPERLEWKGSHLGATVSPDGRFRGHHHAGTDAARLADCRSPAHAHVGLCGARHLGRLDHGWQMAGDLGLQSGHPLAIRHQGRADGQTAALYWRRPSTRSRWWRAIRGRILSPPATATAWC